MTKPNFPRTVRFTNWDVAATANDSDPASLLIAKEEADHAPAESHCSDSAHQLHAVLSYWIGDLNPLRALRISAAIGDVRIPTRPERWIAKNAAGEISAADTRRRIADQLRIIHQSADHENAADDYNFELARAVLTWLLSGRRPCPRNLVHATRGVYLLATRIDPALIAHQSLGALSALWCVSREALSKQCGDIFDGTGIAGTYTAAQRQTRSAAARGNQSHSRAR